MYKISANDIEESSMEVFYECRLKLYTYYIENRSEFINRPGCVREAIVDYAQINDLPLPDEWLILLDSKMINTKDELTLVESIKIDKSMKAYEDALRGAWESYTDKQKTYLLNYAKTNELFVPSYWKIL